MATVFIRTIMIFINHLFIPGSIMIMMMIVSASAFQLQPRLSSSWESVNFKRSETSKSISISSPRKETRLNYSLTSNNSNAIDVAESAPRDIASFNNWAANCGIQTSDGFQLVSADVDGHDDVYAVTNQDTPEGSPIVCIPNELILTGSKARQELGSDAYQAEQALPPSDHMSFYLFLKVLKEYELGEQSFWYPWLNSLPRYYSNGGSLTDFCFGCLPPYAAELALAEKHRLGQFVRALDGVSCLSDRVKSDPDLTKWAFAVVHTRYFDLPEAGDYCIAPMADYFNHGGDEIDAYVSFDGEGNCYAHSTRDVPAGQPLRICYGDPTNPSNLLARYGFLDESSPATFCKYVISNPSYEVFDLGYPGQMLFYKDGGISNEVWDVLLYEELGKQSPGEQQAFHQAHMADDETTKQSNYEKYFSQTHSVLQKHVDYLVNELDELSENSWRKDIDRHPRLPLLMRHNDFVRNTFELVQQNLDNMIS